jgi:DNA-binding MarR family transcriptional regulator
MASVRQSRKAAGETNAATPAEPGARSPGKPDRAADHLNNRIFFRLFQVANTLQKQAVKELGVTTVQWAVLGALSDPRPTYGIAVGTLADFLVVSRQNLDGVLKRLERDDHVVLIADTTDRRARLIKLTPQGRRLWSTLQPKIYEFYRQAMLQFRFDDSIAFVHYLNRLQADLLEVKLP